MWCMQFSKHTMMCSFESLSMYTLQAKTYSKDMLSTHQSLKYISISGPFRHLPYLQCSSGPI